MSSPKSPTESASESPPPPPKKVYPKRKTLTNDPDDYDDWRGRDDATPLPSGPSYDELGYRRRGVPGVAMSYWSRVCMLARIWPYPGVGHLELGTSGEFFARRARDWELGPKMVSRTTYDEGKRVALGYLVREVEWAIGAVGEWGEEGEEAVCLAGSAGLLWENKGFRKVLRSFKVPLDEKVWKSLG